MARSIEELRKQYYQAIIYLQDKENIVRALPTTEFKNFFPIMKGIIQVLQQNIEEMNNLHEDEKDEQMKEYIDEERKSLLWKKEICEELYRKGQEIEIEQQSAEVTPIKNLVFATTEAGNVYFERDLKDIPEEYYESVRICLSQIEKNVQENNSKKAKVFSNNAKLAGLHEVKGFKIRVIYKYINSDTAYIMMVKLKKDDNSQIDREPVIIRSQQTDKQYKKIKEEIQKDLRKIIILEENEKIRERIFQILTRTKENSKNG